MDEWVLDHGLAQPQYLVAAELLDTALKLFYVGECYYAALHLAGGAEELLAKLLEGQGRTAAFADMVEAVVTLSPLVDPGDPLDPKWVKWRLNEARNATKHDRPDGHVRFDPRAEAQDLLDRAVSNYYCAMEYVPLPETVLIRRFLGHEHLGKLWCPSDQPGTG
ncbi:hypothetical protein [Caldimonas brevitalea]|uniref:HEPN domain-containing protein n=1 Tax=Caldimonas brevitalea TaxID=413882 RepID=A0A0G3BH74_9BURK|nr:hypothetical protein [Caldimonas brevitalea]AKJ28712.1 hypothetical protein AAW51_2021 [Caldimonas brevitalea]